MNAIHPAIVAHYDQCYTSKARTMIFTQEVYDKMKVGIEMRATEIAYSCFNSEQEWDRPTVQRISAHLAKLVDVGLVKRRVEEIIIPPAPCPHRLRNPKPIIIAYFTKI